MRGEIAKEGNQLIVRCHGFRRLTVWLGRDMIDFTKPVTIRINVNRTWSNGGRPIKPSVSTMLEDFYARGDRQRLFYAKVEFDGPF